MRVVLDTNVFVSGVFFSGPPFEILKAWRDDKVQIALSPAIMDEYKRVGDELSNAHPGIDVSRILELLLSKSYMVEAPVLLESVCSDPDDDMFLACAVAAAVPYIVSGDKHLRRIGEYRGVKIVSPRGFVDTCL